MWNQIKKLFAAPVFPGDEGKTRAARNTSATSIALIALIAVYQLISLPRIANEGALAFDYIIIGLGVIVFLLWVAVKRGAVYFAAGALVAVFWLATNGTSAIGDGVRGSAFVANLPTILLAGLLFGWHGSLLYAFASILAGYGLAYLESSGRILPEAYPPFSHATDMTMILFLTGVLTFFLIADLTRATNRSKADARLLEQNLASLQAAQSELLSKTDALEKRTNQLSAANAVTQTVTGTREIEIVLPVAVHELAEKFGYYHVGIYLIDEKMEYCFLQAASSEGGKRMLARQYQVNMADEGILQRAALKRAPQIAQGIDAEAARLENPDLPLTRSRGAFPLLARERVTGILDIQNSDPLGFSASEMDTLQIIADQISLTVDNARLLADSQTIIEQMKRASDTRAYHSWRELISRGAPVYQYTPLAVQKIGAPPERKEETGVLSVPILLRGQGIGRLHIKRKTGTSGWLEAEQNMVREVASQIALALDNARLLEDAQARASRERSIGEMSARIGAAVNIESILRATAQEIGKAFGDSEVTVQLNPESMDA